MTKNEMADLIAEILAVDTEEEFANNIQIQENKIKFTTKENETFTITITK